MSVIKADAIDYANWLTKKLDTIFKVACPSYDQYTEYAKWVTLSEAVVNHVWELIPGLSWTDYITEVAPDDKTSN